MTSYKYTQTWFLGSEIKQLLSKFLDTNTKNTILEIGCFEGLSSVFFADNFLNHTDSTLTCVDPFLNINNNDHKQFLSNNEEKNFDYNLAKCNNSHKIHIKKITSDKFFEENKKMFNFIYIDGCHEPDFVIRDMENSFKFLEKHGIMWMDDYMGGDGSIKKAMDQVLDKLNGQYELLHKNYQLVIRKL